MNYLIIGYSAFLIVFVLLKIPYSLYTVITDYNFVVFSTLRRYISSFPDKWAVLNIIGNTVPFFILGILIKKAKKWNFISFLAVISSMIIIIESVQLTFVIGTFDIDDIWINSLSTLLGYILFLKKESEKK